MVAVVNIVLATLALAALIAVVVMAVLLPRRLSTGRLDVAESRRAMCPAGRCASNIYSGSKRCPATDDAQDAVEFDPVHEECTARRTCATARAPFLYYDPSIGTRPGGVCPSSVPPEQCGCVAVQYCPDEVTTWFEPINVSLAGSEQAIDTGLTQQKRFLVMRDSWTDAFAETRAAPPLSISGTGGRLDGVCGVSLDNVDQIWPTDLARDNRCLIGRLVYDARDGLGLRCLNHAAVASMRCAAPFRIVRSADEQFSCEAV